MLRTLFRGGGLMAVILVLAGGCAFTPSAPSERTFCLPSYKSGLTVCKTYYRGEAPRTLYRRPQDGL